MLVFPELSPNMQEMGLEQCFYAEANQDAFNKLIGLSRGDYALVEPRLKAVMNERNFLSLMDHSPIQISHVKQACEELIELRDRRNAIASLENLTFLFADSSYENAVSEAENFALSLTDRGGLKEKWRGKNGEFLDFEGYLDEPDEKVIKTGLSDLDKYITLMPGTLNLFIARPAMGKSMLSTWIADEIAYRQDKPVLLVTLEMSPKEIQLRRLAKHTEINSQKILKKRLLPLERERAIAFWQAMNNGKLHYDGNPLSTIGSIRSSIKTVIAKEGGIDLLVVDYLQLLSREKSNKADELDVITLELRALLREFSIPGIVLAQLNRGNESRPEKRPELSDIRSSGAIEQHADTVTGIYREEYYDKDTRDSNITELIVLKNRTGPTGTINICHDITTGRYFNLLRNTGAA